MQYQKLLSIMDKEVYPLLWKSSYTEEFLIDFLNAYFGFTGEKRISSVTILAAKEFTKDSDVKKRIHFSFSVEDKMYYYEMKLTDKPEDGRCFDFSFLSFAKYCWNQIQDKTKVRIGQIILNFHPAVLDHPIDNYFFRNNHLESLEDGLDIHIINLYAMNRILKTKSYVELNLLERWIGLLLCESVAEAKKICMEYQTLNNFLKIWNYHSKRIQYKRLSFSSDDTLSYLLEKKSLEIKRKIALKLLKSGSTSSFVAQVTDLDIHDVLELKQSVDKKENQKHEV